MARGKFALIVLGGAHDLADIIDRHGDRRWEYLRVATPGYHRARGK